MVGSGRVRHAVYLGLREDKTATEVVREPADPEAERKIDPAARAGGRCEARPNGAVPPRRSASTVPPAARAADRDGARTRRDAA